MVVEVIWFRGNKDDLERILDKFGVLGKDEWVDDYECLSIENEMTCLVETSERTLKVVFKVEVVGNES